MPLTRIQTDALKDAITSSNIADGTITTADVSSTAYGVVQNSFRNKIINGDMRIDQRKAGTSVTAIDDLSVATDMWSAMNVGSGALTIQRVADAPAGFTYSTKWTMPSSVPTLGTNDGYAASQKIEGINLGDLKYGTASAKSLVLSFWVKCSVAGTFPVSIGNYDGSASPIFNAAYDSIYTISQANTWEYKTITIAPQTSFTPNTSATIGLGVYWGFGAGSLRTSQATGSWYSQTRRIGTITGTTSLINTANATFQLTGVQLEAGTTATPFEYRPYSTEMALCQRYFYKFNSPATCAQGFGHNQSTTQMRILFPTPVEMRATPSFASLGSLGLASGGTSFIASAASVLGTSANGVHVEFTVSGATQHQTSVYRDSAGVTFTAEM